MIRISNVALPLGYTAQTLRKKAAARLCAFRSVSCRAAVSDGAPWMRAGSRRCIFWRRWM